MKRKSGVVGRLLLLLFYAAVGVLSEEGLGRAAYPGVEIIEPTQVLVGSFFHGEDIRVRAVFPCDCQFAVRILGPPGDLKLMRKGQVGWIWMNTDEITFRHIPQVYLLWTSGKAAGNGTGGLRELKFDYSSALDGCLAGQTLEDREFLVRELIKLKERDHLFTVQEGVIRTRPVEKRPFSQADAVLHLPSKIYPGTYTLELIAFKEGHRMLLRSCPLEVKLTGFPAALLNLARQNGLLYGALAVAIAILCGLFMGVFFGSRGGH